MFPRLLNGKSGLTAGRLWRAGGLGSVSRGLFERNKPGQWFASWVPWLWLRGLGHLLWEAPLSPLTLTQSSSTLICLICWTLCESSLEKRVLLPKEHLKGKALAWGSGQTRTGDGAVDAELRKRLRPPWYLSCISKEVVDFPWFSQRK